MVNKITVHLSVFLVLCLHAGAQKQGDAPHLQPAESYLVDQFKEKEVIFLGELHRIREQVEFVGKLIPVLHQNGIHLLFSEFARFRDTRRIDSLVTAKTFDYKLAERIMYDDSWDWGYREYADIYYAAWETNRSLKPHEKPFRIIGLEDYDNEFTGVYDPEQFWAHLIDSIGIKKGEKALVWCGMNHAFTAYKQPYIINDTLKGFVNTRVGNLLYKKYPLKTITILMHGPWGWRGFSNCEVVLPGNGQIDSLVVSRPEWAYGAGFSTTGVRLGDISLGNTSYGVGYKDLRLKDLCQGYLIIKPICELNPVTPIPGFINTTNLDETIKRANLGNLSPAAFNDTIKSWLYEYSTKNLELIRKKYCN